MLFAGKLTRAGAESTGGWTETVTFVNAEVLNAALLCAVTANPARKFVLSGIVWGLPT